MKSADIFKLFGVAAFYSSLLEEALDHICIMNETVMNQDKYKRQGNNYGAVKKFEKTTLGNYIANLKKVLDSDKHSSLVDDMFKPALEKRNYLIHNFYIKNQDRILKEDRLNELAGELKSITSVIEQASKIACTMREEIGVLYHGGT
tara:strand:+ start:143 stop:583 length:441 start_codon:yes stop_codon:yes gene_type:complete